MHNTLPISEGQLVSSGGENWLIVSIEDTGRVMARRTRDQRREFLAIETLGPPLPASADTDDETDGSEATDVASKRFRYPQFNHRRIRNEDQTRMLDPKRLADLEQVIAEYKDIKEILRTPKPLRRPLIEALATRFGYSIPTAYRHIALVDKLGVLECLLRPIRKDAGQRHILPEVAEVIRTHLARYRFVPTPEPLKEILVRINGYCREHHLPKVSASTLRSFEKEVSRKDVLLAQGRPDKARDLYRPKVGHLPNADFPLAIVQVDHTPLQICLVASEGRQPIGKAFLTLVIDSFSRMVLGFYLSFDAPSTLSVGIALSHAFLPKENYLRSLDVPGEWPCWGFPSMIQVDNGAELNGAMMQEAKNRYMFNLRNRPVGSPNFGGTVESAFRTFMFEQKSTPGTTFANPQERGEYDADGNAILTLAEFERRFVDYLVNDYHLKEHSGEGMNRMAPLQMWKKGLFEGVNQPPLGLPDRPLDELHLKISLLPFMKRTITNATINLFSETYHCGELTLMGDRLDRSLPLEQRQFEVRYDPRDMSMVWLLDPTTLRYIPVPFADLGKPSISLWELKARNRRLGRPADEYDQERFSSKLRRDDITETAREKTRKARKESERQAHREKNALAPKVAPEAPLPTPVPSPKKLSIEELKSKIRLSK